MYCVHGLFTFLLEGVVFIVATLSFFLCAKEAGAGRLGGPPINIISYNYIIVNNVNFFTNPAGPGFQER